MGIQLMPRYSKSFPRNTSYQVWFWSIENTRKSNQRILMRCLEWLQLMGVFIRLLMKWLPQQDVFRLQIQTCRIFLCVQNLDAIFVPVLFLSMKVRYFCRQTILRRRFSCSYRIACLRNPRGRHYTGITQSCESC